MAHHNIKLEGLAELQKGLAKRIQLDDMKRIVKTNGSQLHRKAQRNAEFRGHWGWEPGVGRKFIKPTGNLKGKIMLEMKDNGLTAEVTPTAEYSAYVEFGTRFMDSQPYLKPAFDDQLAKFKSDINKLIN